MDAVFNVVRRVRPLLFVWHVLAFILLINFLVIPHELGHLLTGLAFGTAVDAFSVGFGPEIFSVNAFGIDWRFSSIPLGGYVQFSAEAGAGEVLIGQLASWKQLVILFSGVTANVLYALAIGYWLKPRINTEVTFPLSGGLFCVPFAVNAGYGVAKGVRPFLWYTGCASIEMAVFNLLPISILDGGRIADILLFNQLRANGVSDTAILLGSVIFALLVLMPLLVKAARPLVNYLRYEQ